MDRRPPTDLLFMEGFSMGKSIFIDFPWSENFYKSSMYRRPSVGLLCIENLLYFP